MHFAFKKIDEKMCGGINVERKEWDVCKHYDSACAFDYLEYAPLSSLVPLFLRFVISRKKDKKLIKDRDSYSESFSSAPTIKFIICAASYMRRGRTGYEFSLKFKKSGEQRQNIT